MNLAQSEIIFLRSRRVEQYFSYNIKGGSFRFIHISKPGMKEESTVERHAEVQRISAHI